MRSDSQGKHKRWFGFGYACNGIKEVVKSEINIKIHLIVALIVLLLGFICQLTRMEWIVLVLTIGSVLSLEMINTAIERLLDYLAPEIHPLVGIIKDISAGAVLVSAVIAVIIGCLLFLPKILQLIL